MKTNEFNIDTRVKSFGSHVLFIRETAKFINEICQEIEKLNMSYKTKPVEYYDKENIDEPINLFQKTLEYNYQREYRIIVKNNKQGTLKISIGSLKEYSEIFAVDSRKSSVICCYKVVLNLKKTKIIIRRN